MRAVKRTISRALPHLPSLLAVAVLVVPLALWAPANIRAELRSANGYSSVFAVPYGVVEKRVAYNKALVAGVVAHVPPHASLATIGASTTDLGTAWTRWVPYVIAPRQMTTGRAKWTMVFDETPQQAHLRPVRSWRYGADWLVER
jgi:hypothetical protein